jgi:hypothetical protein
LAEPAPLLTSISPSPLGNLFATPRNPPAIHKDRPSGLGSTSNPQHRRPVAVRWAHRDGKGYGVTLNFIPRSPDAELVIRAIEPKPAAQAGA